MPNLLLWVILCAAPAPAADSFSTLVESVRRADPSGRPESAADAAVAERISDAAIARRRQMVIRAIATDPSFSIQRKNPKYQHAIVSARLALDPHDAQALEYVRRAAAFPDSFAFSGLSGLVGRFGDGWSGDVTEAVRQAATGWDGFLGGGTENHVAMRRTAGLLLGERFPDDRFRYGLTGRQVAEECKKYMRAYGQAVYGGSMVEYLSPIYLATNTAAWINAAECARDDEARLMSQAILDWMLADQALNVFEGSTVAPIQREKGLLTGTYQRSYAEANTQWVSWLFFGGGNTPDDGGTFASGREPYKPPPGFHAVSKWLPHPVIRNVAAKRVAAPYSALQSRSGWAWIEPTMTNAYGKKEATGRTGPGLDGPRYHFRSAYFNRDYAIGAGSFQTDPEDPLTHTLVPFGVWWKSPDENNFLLVAHPYWYSQMAGDEGEQPLGDEDWIGISPFCRAVHWENAAVLLYDLPETDPYAELVEHGKRRFPSARSQKVIQSVFVYVPDTVDERVNDDCGFFIREGDVYVAIRPLAPGARWTTSKHPGFVRIELPGPVTGAAIEVGDRREYGSLEEFRAKVAAARLDVSQLAAAKAVEYVSSRSHRLRVAEVPGTWLPEASVDGIRLDFARWPIAESPWLRCNNRVLEVNDGRAGLSIDWRGDLPVYTFYELREGKRAETGRRFIRDGRLVSEGK